MNRQDDEDKLLHSVAIENAKSIARARNRAEDELVRAKEALEKRTQELAHSLAMMRATLESTTDGILVTDFDGKVTGFNERFLQMWEVPRSLIEAGEHRQIVEATSRYFNEPSLFIARIDEIYTLSMPESDDVFELADGRVYERFSRIQYVDGKDVGRVWSFRDITERKQLADSREKTNRELRQLAANLSEADRRKNEFLAMLAHELRNPLAPIRNSLQILQMFDGDRDTLRTASEMMARQVNQLVRLVDDLLDVSRISRDKIELRRKRIDLADVIEQAVEAARPSCENGGVELDVKMPEKPVHVNGDSDRLVQVIGNLLNNSCKFTERGGRIDTVLESNGVHAVVRVKDTGIGLDPDQLPFIFDMFVQADTSLERAASGLGIGLTLVQNLVQMHGGSVEASSAGLGKGSEFAVMIPLDLGPDSEKEMITVLEGKKVTSRRILVVDDNIDSAESMALLLKISGHEVEMAHDGLEAVERTGQFLPEVLLLDIGLPTLNGFEVAREIRRQSWGEKIVLIALTGWGQEEDRRKSKEAGFDEHMVKPVDHRLLLSFLAELD